MQRALSSSESAPATISDALRGRLTATILGTILAATLAMPAGASARPLAVPSAEPPVSPEAPAEPSPEAAEDGEGAPVEPPPSPTARNGRGCRLSLESSSALLTAGDAVTLEAKLACANPASAAGAPITISAQRHGSGMAASALATASMGSEGSYALTVSSVAATTTFSVRTPSAHGAHTVVKVLPLVTLAGPAGTQLGTRGRSRAGAARNRVSFTGTVSPVAAGSRVALQSEYSATGEKWRTIALTRVDGAGHFAFLHSFRLPGEINLRAVTHPKGATSGASQPLTYVVSQAQNPALTIQTSLDPLFVGQAATISGVAAGTAREHVTLLARTAGHPFATVATAATDEGGAYSFNVSPRQSTAYEVSAGAARSTVLFEGVKYRLSPDAAPAAVEALAPIALSGALVPAPAGQIVYLEQQNGSGRGFHVIATATVDGAQRYTIGYTFSKPAAYVLRIKAPASESSQASVGEPFTLTVTPAAPAVSSEGSEEEEPAESEAGESGA